MLVLSRKKGQKIVLGYGTPQETTMTINKVIGSRVHIGIDAPQELTVFRDELVMPVTEADKLAQLEASKQAKQ